MAQNDTSLCFVSWNICNIKTNISDVRRKLLNIRTDVAFIQETHKTNGWTALENVEGWKSYFTVYNSKSVAILIRDKEAFEYICHDEDPCGGYIVLFCHLYGQLFTLVNVYNFQCDRDVLRRLTDYLKETTEGMLVVGGDFNTVLNPWIDQRSLVHYVQHSPVRNYLEDFITSLNLRDTWSYSHPTNEGFTQCQDDRKSRLDMFFIPDDMMNAVISCNPSSNTINTRIISDHYPLILKLNLKQQHEKKTPKVASKLKEIKQDRTAERRPGLISGAEILSVIKSMTDSNEERADHLTLDYYKRYCCPMTEILKIQFNCMIANNCISDGFNKYNSLGDQHTFNVNYLILSRILAKRLSVFFTPSLRGRKIGRLNALVTVTFPKQSQKINWSFLNKCLSNLKQTKPARPRDFTILKSLLHKDKESSVERRHLKIGCPLTNTILNLALTQLKSRLLFTNNSVVCFYRQALFIDIEPHMFVTVNRKVKEFGKESGLKIIITSHKCKKKK